MCWHPHECVYLRAIGLLATELFAVTELYSFLLSWNGHTWNKVNRLLGPAISNNTFVVVLSYSRHNPMPKAMLRAEYFKHAVNSPLFFLFSKCHLFHNATFFGSCVIHISYTECAKIKKKKKSGAKGLTERDCKCCVTQRVVSPLEKATKNKPEA